MKIPMLLFSLSFACIVSNAQVGVGTTSPHSILDVRGSWAAGLRTFTNATSADINDYSLVFTGTSATTLTLPTAVGIAGRMYSIKNASSNISTLTIATTSSQTVDGFSSYTVDDQFENVVLASDGANWRIVGHGLPGGSGTNWTQGGNTLSATRNLGTISNHDLPFITANTQKMKLTTGGSLIVGSSTSAVNGTNPEKLLVDAGTTTSYNVISGKGSIDNYLQLNIQNTSTGTSASSDIVATANNGSETVNFVNLGINGGSNTTTGIYGGSNTAYLYSTGTDFAIGNAATSRHLMFFTNGTASANERMRITSAGNVGIANTTPAEKLDVTGNVRFSGALMPNGAAGTLGYVLTSSGAGAAPTWQDGTTYVTSNAWTLNGNNVPALRTLGTTSNFDLPFITTNVERMRLNTSGNLGIGTTAPTEKLHVDGNIRLSGLNKSIFFDADTDPYAGIKNVSRTGEINELMIFSGNDVAGTYGPDRIRLATHEIHFATTTSNPGLNTGDATTNFENLTTYPTQMIINQSGNVGIGTTTFSATNPEKLSVLMPNGNNSFQNVIVGKGNTNSYAQLNIQNTNTGTSASSDVVATADNGNETKYYVDMGLNSSGNNQNYFGGSNDMYLYAMGDGASGSGSTGGNLYIGTATASKDIAFLTGGGTKAVNANSMQNERMRILGSNGFVGINTNTPNSTFSVNGSVTMEYRTISANRTLDETDYTVINTGGAITITLPGANTCPGRVYLLINQGSAAMTTSMGIIIASGTNSTTVPNTAGTNVYQIISDGTSWRKIN